MSKRLFILILIVVCITIGLIYYARNCASDVERAGRTKLTIQLQWEPSAQFLGFYVAKQRGYYADEKLDVNFLHGGPDVNPIANIVQKNAEIGLATADQVLRWNDSADKEKVIIALGTVFYRSLAVFMVRTSSGIQIPKDLKDKRVGVFPSYDTESLLWLLLENAGIKRDDVVQTNFPNFSNFEHENLDAYGAYLINEPILARLKGIDVTFIDPWKHGIRFYSDTIIARKDYYLESLKTIEAFMRASLRGWSFAEQNIDSALEYMGKEIGTLFGKGLPWNHQKGVAFETIKYLRGDREKIFVMDRNIWEEMDNSLRKLGILKKSNLIEKTLDFSIAERINANK